MVDIRKLSAVVLAALAAGATLGVALADPPPWAHARRFESTVPRAQSTLSGTIAGVDYANATILVATPHGIVPVGVTPSTQIVRGSQYASFTDIGRGAHVEIDVATIGGRLVAQLIRIR